MKGIFKKIFNILFAIVLLGLGFSAISMQSYERPAYIDAFYWKDPGGTYNLFTRDSIEDVSSTVISDSMDALRQQVDAHRFQLIDQFKFNTQDLCSVGTGNHDFPLGAGIYYDSLYNRIYFTYFVPASLSGDTAYNYVAQVDLTSGDVSSGYKAISGGYNSNNSHGKASIIVNNLGEVLVAMDSVVAGNHNQGAIISYSDAGDITNWTKATGTRLYDPEKGTKNSAYPTLYRLGGDSIVTIVRMGGPSTDHHTISIFTSTDNGHSWPDGYTLCTLYAADTVWRAYPMARTNRNNNKLGLIVNERYSNLAPPSRIFFLESTDGGVTWENIDKSFSKDIVASDSITRSEMYTNFVIDTSKSPDGKRHQVNAWNYAPNDSPYVLITHQTSNRDTSRIYFGYWGGSSWTTKLVDVLHDSLKQDQPGPTAFGIYSYGADVHDIWITNKDNSAAVSNDSLRFQRWRTTDKGDNWMLVEDLHPNTTYDSGPVFQWYPRFYFNDNYAMINANYLTLDNNSWDIIVYIYKKKE